MHRCLVAALLLTCVLGHTAATEEGDRDSLWSGVILYEESFVRPPAEADELQRLEAFAATLRNRISLRRQHLEAAQAAERALIEQDIIALEGDLREVQQQAGGQQELSQTRFQLHRVPRPGMGDWAESGALVRAEVGGGILIANWSEGLLRGRDRWQRFDGALPLRTMDTLPLPEEPGDPFANQETRRLRVDGPDGPWQVDVLPRLPNPWAGIITTDLDDDHFVVILGRLPGMPVRCQRELRGGGSLRFTVITVSREDPDPSLFANP